MSTQLFVESVVLLEADKDNRTVTQKIIAVGESANRRFYPADVVKRATQLFEGVKTYADHPSKNDIVNRPERSISDLTGWIDNVHFNESMNAIVGTRHFTTNQKGQDAWQLAKQVVFENAPPSLFGASINALGKGVKRDDGVLEVTEISRAISVDDVTSPAAGGGFDKLLASDGGIVAAVMSELSYEEWFEARPDFIKRAQNEWKQPRQTKALKAALAEAGGFKAQVERLSEDNATMRQAYEAIVSELDMVRRELVVIETLQKVRGLPAEWRESLRQQLVESDPDEWGTIIATEQQKAKRVSSRIGGDDFPVRRVQQAYKPTPIQESLAPKDGEDYRTWQQRISKLKG